MNQLTEIGAKLDEVIALSQDLLVMSEQDEPDLDRLELGFQNRGELLSKIQSGSSLINWQNELPDKERDQVLKSFNALKEIDSKLRGHLSFLLDQKKQALQEVQRNEKADKRYQKKQRVDHAMFIRNKLEG